MGGWPGVGFPLVHPAGYCLLDANDSYLRVEYNTGSRICQEVNKNYSYLFFESGIVSEKGHKKGGTDSSVPLDVGIQVALRQALQITTVAGLVTSHPEKAARLRTERASEWLLRCF